MQPKDFEGKNFSDWEPKTIDEYLKDGVKGINELLLCLTKYKNDNTTNFSKYTREVHIILIIEELYKRRIIRRDSEEYEAINNFTKKVLGREAPYYTDGVIYSESWGYVI